jgi:glycosyltransferase involved in cell wall biosynthesis
MQLYVQRLSEALQRRGHSVTILTARHRGDLPAQETVNGVRIVRLWAAPVRVSRGVLLPQYPWAARKLIAEHDVVSVHTPLLEAPLIAGLAGLAARPVVLTHHGDLTLPPGAWNRFVERAMFRFYSFAARRAQAIVAYSEDYARHSMYLRQYPGKVEVIPPPVEIPQPRPEAVRSLRESWAPHGGPVIGYAGRFVREKRPDVLIRALETVDEKYPGTRIVFAGERQVSYESTWRDCRALVESRGEQVVFLGLLEDPQRMADFYAACDVIALPSDSECFGLVQVEAMLCGTPVVATDIAGGRVPVRLTGMGEVVPPGNPRALGEALLGVLDNPERYVRPRSEIERIFPLQQAVDRYETVFRQACGG